MVQESTNSISIVKTINEIAYGRLLPAALWLMAAAGMTSNLITSVTERDWLLAFRNGGNLVFTLLIVGLFMFRHSVKGPRAKPLEALTALAGTFAPAFIASESIREPNDALLLAGSFIGLIGMAWAIISLATLGRCFGLFPEARGLVMHGPYGLVRHPLYLGEIVMTIGMLLPVLSLLNITIGCSAIGLQIWRADNEERALSSVFPEYSDYKERTKRLIPFIW